jgi:hypothetical protein
MIADPFLTIRPEYISFRLSCSIRVNCFASSRGPLRKVIGLVTNKSSIFFNRRQSGLPPDRAGNRSSHPVYHGYRVSLV